MYSNGFVENLTHGSYFLEDCCGLLISASSSSRTPDHYVGLGSAADVQASSLGMGEDAAALWEFPKTGVPYFGVLIIRLLLFRVLY